ncbi:MAG: NAD+ synthase [Chloroflexota bacterium]|nr:NAD+ synthase [Chloroflexota bacterium]MDE2970099.1 NAD+ synthase [Chloroflexota bacterium]
MRTFRLALAQVNPTVGDIAGNTDIVLRRIEEARERQADLVAFPELMLTGYPPEDLLLKPSFIHDNLSALDRVVAASQGITVVVGFVNSEGNQVYNAAAVVSDGSLAGVYHKVYLPNYGVFDEDRYFRPGRVCPVYTINAVAVGVNICEDIWYALGPVPLQREAGAEVIVNINGSPYHAGKFAARERMLGTRAADNGVYIGYVNTVGGQDELVFDGASVVLDVDGVPVARAAQFHEELLVADLDVERVFHRRLRAPLDRKETASTLEAIGRTEQVFVSGFAPSDRAPEPERMAEPLDPVGEVYNALVLGTRDYVRKNGFGKVLVSLSGGIDSSLTCVVAVDALGAENVEGIAMPSRYSSDGSVTDSEALAEALGVPLRVVPIEGVHGSMEEALHPIFDGTEPNIAEQNVQARIRGNLLMAVSNKFGWLVLPTGNKSELAMGYATLYGDMAGGFGVIKDVPKTLVYQLSEWRNRNGEPASPIPQSVIDKPPSAELKPDQRDDDDLPPYSLLDQVLELYVEQDRSYDEMVDMGFDAAIVARVMRAVDRNEFKRRQGAVGIKITPRAFGRDRRMPIVNRYQGNGR